MLRRVRLWGNISRAGGEVARQKMTDSVEKVDGRFGFYAFGGLAAKVSGLLGFTAAEFAASSILRCCCSYN
jgi:hypothetical protein